MIVLEELAQRGKDTARRVATLEAQEVTVVGSGTTVPATNAQNQMIISNATPAWSLLAAPSAQYQVPVAGADPYTPAWAALTVAAVSDLAYAAPALTLSTANAEGAADTVIRSDATILVFDATAPDIIQPDDAAAAGSAVVAARRDHTHGIVCAAPASPSVNLSASAEGSGTSFARADHAHQLSQAIVPVWTGLHTFSGGTPANQHAVTYRQAVLENDGSTNLQIIGEDGVTDMSALVLSKAPSTGDNRHWIVAQRQAGFAIAYHASAGAFSSTAATDHLTIDAAGVFKLIIADNAALAAQFSDVGGIEYLRVVSTDAQPVVVFNEAGADVDLRVEAVGQANALFVQGSTGNIGGKTNTPATDWHVVGSTVANKHYGEYRTQILEDDNVVLQLIGEDATTGMAHIVLTGAPASGDNKHWIISHLGPPASNRFTIGYKTSNADDFPVYNATEHLVILLDGNTGLGESAPAEKLEVAGSIYAHSTFKTARSESAGWARGIHVYADANLGVELAGIGAYGLAGAAPSWLYMTIGDNPWESTTGIIVDDAGRVSLGTLTPATSAKLELVSTTGALLLTRMTTAQRDALTAVNGMVLYNSTTGAFNFREGGAWVTK